MANTFKNVIHETNTDYVAAYTCPAATTAIIIGCQASNKSNTGAVEFGLQINTGVNIEFLVNDVTIPEDASLAPIAGKLVLEAGDALEAKTGGTADVSLVISILEIT